MKINLNNKIFLILITLIVNSYDANAKNTKQFDMNFEAAQIQFKLGNYYKALPMYLELYKLDSSNYNISYLVGVCYKNGRTQRKRALYYLEKAATHTTKNYKQNSSTKRDAPTFVFMLLGDEYQRNSKFDKAINAYNNYKSEMAENNEKDKVRLKEVDRKLVISNNAKLFTANPVAVTIENMGKEVNSIYGDYSPVLTLDQNTLIFTSRRKKENGGKMYNNGRYFEDIYVSHKNKNIWEKAINIGAPINTNGNEASVGISPDGQEILIYKDDKGDGNIYSTSLNGNIWSTPLKLNSNINSKHWEPSAFISADGQSIYFISNRPGGFGGRDIYVSNKNENNEWGKAKNLGPSINT